MYLYVDLCPFILRAVLLNVFGVIILVIVTSLAGIVMFAYYAQIGCDPLTSGQVSNSNQLIPLFVMEVLGYPGLPGLFVSCLFSGALRYVGCCRCHALLSHH